jgi:glycosyltransferase involved in cell wall biosynthesis
MRILWRVVEGVNVVGYFDAELGVGEAARLLLRGIEARGIPHRVINVPGGTQSRREHPFVEANGGGLYSTNVICLNPPELRSFALDAGPEFFRGRYAIGVWWWEVPQVAPDARGAIGFVDEIWVGSEYVRGIIAAETDRPVHVVPLPMPSPAPTSLERSDLALPEGFLFLFMFDFLSVFERKNPLAAVDAFSRAFAPGEGAVLVVKSVNGDLRPEQLARLRAASDRPDIHIVDRYVTTDEKDAWLAACDCYVSLHRSEGFGLILAEAMALGKPVIATGYSGNLDFMDSKTSYLVPYTLTPIPPGCDPYPEGVPWAEPDVTRAAELMRHVYDNPVDATRRAAKAREALATRRAPAVTGAFVEARVAAAAAAPRGDGRAAAWRALAAARGAIDRVGASLMDAERSQRPLIGSAITGARALVLRTVGARYRLTLIDALHEILLMQQHLTKHLDDLDARLRQLEERDSSQ